MRPSIDEILAGAQQALDDVIVPDLQSSYARSRARMVTRMIAYVRRTLAGLAAWQTTEIAELTRLLTTARDTLAARGSGTADARAAADRLTAILTGPDTPNDEAAETRLTALQAALDGTIRVVDAHLGDRPDEDLQALRGEIRAYLRAALERELALTGTRRETVAP